MYRLSPLLLLLINLSLAAEQHSSLTLEEVIVSAQKRTESLQDTPISITAFDESRLEKDGINNLGDIASSVPSLSMQPFPIDNSTLALFIRGVGLVDSQSTQDPAVAVYLDNAYLARSSGLTLDIADLSRIEVLKGPQGTLYGRNATGGAVNLISKRPNTQEWEFQQKLGVASRNAFSSKTSLNIPIGESAALKFAYIANSKDGYLKNNGPGGDYGDKSAEGWRMDFTWDISEIVRLDYSYDHSLQTYYNQTYQAIDPPELSGGTSTNDVIVDGLKRNSTRFYNYPGEDKRQSSATSAVPNEESSNEVDGHALRLHFNVSDAFNLLYIATYRDSLNLSFTDLTASGSLDYRIDSHAYTSRDGSLSLPLAIPRNEHEQTTHEFQFTGTLLESDLSYIGGLYYFEETSRGSTYPIHHSFSGAIDVQETATTRTTTFLVNAPGVRGQTNNSAWAAFGRLTYSLPFWDERLSLTLGGRHSEDTREAYVHRTAISYVEIFTEDLVLGTTTGAPPIELSRNVAEASPKRDFQDDSFEVIVEADATDTVNIYAKWVQGYKSGGYNVRDPDVDRFSRGFDEETITSTELGVKSEWLDRRLRVNANLFSSDYEDIQVNFLLPNSIADTKVANAGEAVIEGIELSANFIVAPGLSLMIDYGYLDAYFTKVVDPDTGIDETDRFVFFSAPDQTWTAAIDWTIAEFNVGRLNLNISANHMGERNGASERRSVRNTTMKGYTLTNARLGLYDIPFLNGTLSASVYGKNIEDVEYVVSAINNLPNASRAVAFGEPRSYGLDLDFRF